MGVEVTGETFHVHRLHHATIIALGEVGLTRQVDITRLMERLGDAIAVSEDPIIVLDCRRVESVGSVMLGELIALNKQLKVKDKQLRLARLNDDAKKVIQITHLESLLPVYDDIKAAVYARAKRRWWWPFGS